jgi:tetratricopeptide (TPR) repeat protein
MAARASRISPTVAALILVGALGAWGTVALWQLRRSPAQTHIAAGDAYAQRGDAVRAVAEWEAAARIDPNNAYVWQVLGQSFFDAQDYARAQRALMNAVRLAPKTPRFPGMLALCALQSHDAEAARGYVRSALALDPNDIPALETQSVLQHLQGDTDGMTASLRRLAMLEPARIDRQTALAQALIAKNAVVELLPVADRLVQLDPNRAESWAQRGLARFYAEGGAASLEKACDDFERSLALRPDIYESHLYLGRIHKRRGAWREAAAALERAIGLRPEKADAYYDLAAIYPRLGQSAKASAARARFQQIVKASERFVHLKKQADLAPENVALNLQVAQLARKRKDRESAVHYLEMARARRPDDPAVQAEVSAVAGMGR